MIELHLRGRVASGRRDDLAAFLAEAIPFYEEPGGIRIRLLWNIEEQADFIEVIEYADQDAYDQDQLRVENDPRMQSFLRRWRELLDGPPRVERFSGFERPSTH